MHRNDQSGEDDGHGGAELDQNVQRRAGGVLEGIAHGVAHDCGLVLLGALAASPSARIPSVESIGRSSR